MACCLLPSPGGSPGEKFRRSGGGLLPVFEPFHVHVQFGAPAGASDVPQPSRHQQHGRVSIGEGAHDASSAPDLPVDSLQGIGRADLEPMFPGERHVGQCLREMRGLTADETTAHIYSSYSSALWIYPPQGRFRNRDILHSGSGRPSLLRNQRRRQQPGQFRPQLAIRLQHSFDTQ